MEEAINTFKDLFIKNFQPPQSAEEKASLQEVVDGATMSARATFAPLFERLEKKEKDQVAELNLLREELKTARQGLRAKTVAYNENSAAYNALRRRPFVANALGGGGVQECSICQSPGRIVFMTRFGKAYSRFHCSNIDCGGTRSWWKPTNQ